MLLLLRNPLPLNNNAEGGTDTTTVTTGNSGSASGNAWNTVHIDATATLTFSAAHAANGTLSYKFTTGGTSGASYVAWTATSIGAGGYPTTYGRVYVYLTAAPATDDNVIGFLQGSSAFGGGIMFGSGTAVLRLQSQSFSEVSGANMQQNAWFRLEYKLVCGAAGAAALTVNVYNTPTSNTIDHTLSDTTNAYCSTNGTCNEVRYGWTSSHVSQPAMYFDDIQLTNTGYPGPVPLNLAGTSTMSGSGSLSPSSGAFGGFAGLSGTGTLGNIDLPWGPSTISGSGTLGSSASVTGGDIGTGALSGSGSMTVNRSVNWAEQAALSGSGTLRIKNFVSTLLGSGTLGISGVILGQAFTTLSGIGVLSIPQVKGGLVNGIGGGTTPYAFPGTSQVAVAPPGSSNWQWLGTLGHVTALTYSFTCPGGADKMTCTLLVPATFRTQLFNPGWQVKIVRGGHQVWYGKLDEPVPSPQGWTLTAVGNGNRGGDFLAVYSDTWPTGEPDESVNNAITRGLPWVNPGIGSPSGIWTGQAVDSGAQSITALLNLVCTRGGLTWYVNSQPGGLYGGDDLTVFPLPTTVNRLLVVTTPVARTLGGDINTIYIRYQSGADNPTSGASATYATTTVQNGQSVAAHGVLETYVDLSDAGTMTSGTAQQVGNYVLGIYQRASFAGPFTASRDQLLNTGGQPIDPGTDQAGTVVKLILTDFGYGGEVTPQNPVTFIVGAYEWDDFAQVATITPYQAVDQSLTGILSLPHQTLLAPIKAGGP